MPCGVGFFQCGFVAPLDFGEEGAASAIAERFDLPALPARRAKRIASRRFALRALAGPRLRASERRGVEFRSHEGIANRSRGALRRRCDEGARCDREFGAEPFDRRAGLRVRVGRLEQAHARRAAGVLARFE